MNLCNLYLSLYTEEIWEKLYLSFRIPVTQSLICLIDKVRNE